MKKILNLAVCLVAIIALGVISEKVSFGRVTDSSDDRDIWCVGPSSYEVCVESSGDLIPTTDDNQDLGLSSLQWQDLYLDGTAYVDAISNEGAYTGTTIGGTVITASGQIVFQNISSTTLRTTVPASTGAVVYCTTYYSLCNSTGVGTGAWVFVSTNGYAGAVVPCDQ